MINNKTYHHVLNFVHSHYPFNIGNNTQIDKVLYDLKEGIIGFDDTKNDIQFRLVNWVNETCIFNAYPVT